MNPLLLGTAAIVADLIAWRVIAPQHKLTLTAIRLALFVAFSWVLFSHGMSPLEGPALPGQPAVQIAAQVLEVAWWLLGARLGIVLLDVIFMRKSWHHDRLFQELLGAVVLLAAAVAATAYVFHVPVGGLIATSGAMAIVIGLAVQSTLSDVFAGLVINTTEPYQPGDWIMVDGVEGKVVEMNWRATHIVNGQGNTVVVPNNVAAKAKITNVSRPPRLHGVSVTLEVTPEARPAVVVAALQRAVSGCRIALVDPAPSVIVKHAGVNSITYEMTCFIADISRTGEATNELFDLAYRHLAAAQIILRPLAVPPALASEQADQRSSLLSKVQMFEVLEGDEVRELASRLSRHEYEASQTIVTADQVIDYLLIVASGVLSVMVHRENPGQPGEKIEIARLGPEDSFGESGVLSGVPMSVDITAMSRVLVYRLDKEDLSPLLKKRPELGHSMCRLLSQRRDYTRTFIHEEEHDVETESGLLHWLREGMRRLHELAA